MITLTKAQTSTKCKIRAAITSDDLEMIKYGVSNYSFLIGINTTINGCKFADMINLYSDHPKTKAIADTFIKADEY